LQVPENRVLPQEPGSEEDCVKVTTLVFSMKGCRELLMDVPEVDRMGCFQNLGLLALSTYMGMYLDTGFPDGIFSNQKSYFG
jgi:hypothetical protein